MLGCQMVVRVRGRWAVLLVRLLTGVFRSHPILLLHWSLW
jgi:hypothetical protein